jgi:hypothetical protein
MKRLLILLVMVAGLALPAWGDWNPEDGHKMHEPQTPDPFGWDVRMSCPTYRLADDWQCSQSGPVDDIHLWVSFLDDVQPTLGTLNLTIYSDIPAGTGDIAYSRPGNPLWTGQFTNAEYLLREWDQGDQGFYTPETETALPNNHTGIWQINVDPILEPFIQQEGTIYWLEANIAIADQSDIGWKTSDIHFNDNAVVWDPINTNNWIPLEIPNEPLPIDLAFVITPEPGTMILLGIGTGGLLFIRRRRRVL